MSGLRAELERVLGLVAEYCENPRREAQHPDEVGCSEHPDAPHGFCRDASHSEDCYVCECRGWEPDPAKDYDCAYEAIAFLKTHGPALLTGQGEDGRQDRVDADCREADALVMAYWILASGASRKDWGCDECDPGGDLSGRGFTCGYHIAKARAKEADANLFARQRAKGHAQASGSGAG